MYRLYMASLTGKSFDANKVFPLLKLIKHYAMKSYGGVDV
jgi:hypothetical protein